MAELAKSKNLLSVAEYLADENDGTTRHEYVSGSVFAMASASERHNLIKLNIAGLLNARVSDQCRVFDGDMKLRTERAGDVQIYYPDVFVVCDGHDDTQYVRTDAVLVIEVLSPSTERTDRYERFDAYRTLPSLAEYVLVDQDMARIEVYRRRTDWLREPHCPDDRVSLESVGLALTFAEIYRRVALPEEPASRTS